MFELELVVTEIGCYLLKSALCANSGEEGATRGAAKSWFLEVTPCSSSSWTSYLALCRLLVEVEREVRGEVSMEEVPGRKTKEEEERGEWQEAREALDSIADQNTSCGLM